MKDRVTLNFSSNASGTINLPVHLIGKDKCPRCFQQLDMKLLPVKFTNQKNSWMTTDQFMEWFHTDFVRYVSKKLKSLGEKPNAVLILDNCFAHPDREDLISDDGTIFAKFLPPNVTALIRPMDQGVIESAKKRHKKKLLRRLIIKDESGISIVDYLKGINLKVVVDLIHDSWTEISSRTLQKSWRKIIPITSPKSRPTPSPHTPLLKELYEMAESDDESTNADSSVASPDVNETHRGCAVWRGIRFRIAHIEDEDAAVDDVPLQDFQILFEKLGVEIRSDEIIEWLSDTSDTGVQIYTDAEICEMLSRPEDSVESEDEESSEEEYPYPVMSHSDAAHMFEWYLSWLERQPEATVHNTSVLRELHALAARKRVDNLKQSKICKYF